MSLNRAREVVCYRCMAYNLIETDGNGRLRETKGACTCPVEVEDLSAGYAAVRTCQTKGCVNSCRFRFCLKCSSARQADSDRNRKGQIQAAPLPKCGCGAQLLQANAVVCRECKKIRNAKYQREYVAAAKLNAESAA